MEPELVPGRGVSPVAGMTENAMRLSPVVECLIALGITVVATVTIAAVHGQTPDGCPAPSARSVEQLFAPCQAKAEELDQSSLSFLPAIDRNSARPRT